MTPKVAWLSHDSTVPLQQGDLLLVAWAKTIVPRLEVAEAAHPIIGKRDAFSLRFWNTHNPLLLDMGGCVNYALAVVVADDCAIDKEFNILRQRYTEDGMEADQAAVRANENAEPYIAIAEVWPVDALPEHLRRDAESGARGYVPFSLGSIVPDDPHPALASLPAAISTINGMASCSLAHSHDQFISW